MYANATEFIDEVTRLFPTIQGQNSWAMKYFALEMPKTGATIAEVNAGRCWSLYCASRDNALGFLLLGEVSMRSKLALVQNFGLTSAHGHEDDEPWLSPWLGTAARDPAAPALTGKPALDASRNAHLQPLQGPGSILSDRLWTPLMNDAWLLGGVHKQQSFHLVTEGLGEAKLTAALDGLKDAEAFERRITRFGALKPGQVPVRDRIAGAWRQWFLDNPQYLYERWGPRVLARELIGLMTFGYEPEFTRQELGFTCVDPALASHASVTAYTEALNRLRFHQGADIGAKGTVLRALSTWLFKDPAVLA